MNPILFYDEFNIYNEPSKDELKKFIEQKYDGSQKGEELAYMAIYEFNLNNDHNIILNEILNELNII